MAKQVKVRGFFKVIAAYTKLLCKFSLC